jgi:hypothetical protein
MQERMASYGCQRNRGIQRAGHERVDREEGFWGHLNLTAWVRALHCNAVYITRFHSMRIPVLIRTSSNKADIRALVDSGATDNFINERFVKRMGLGMAALPQPRQLFNIDNTNNKGGMITHYVDLQVDTSRSSRDMQFLITNIGKEDVLLGYPWLSAFEPKFSWTHGTIDEKVLPVVIKSKRPEINKEVLTHLLSETNKYNIIATPEEQCTIKSMATILAIAAGPAKEVVIPKEYELRQSIQ